MGLISYRFVYYNCLNVFPSVEHSQPFSQLEPGNLEYEDQWTANGMNTFSKTFP